MKNSASNKFWKFSNPVLFKNLAYIISPLAGLIAILAIIPGLVWGVFFTNPDYKQMETVKIIFIHVPAAFLAINIYFMMTITSLVWLIRRHYVSALAAKSAAIIGLTMTIVTIITGSLWGSSTWGTYWVWDARITSTFILLLQYIGLYVLRTSFNSISTSDTVISIFAIIGAINIPIIKFSVNWWNTLHQGPSITSSGSTIAGEFLTILILMMISLLFLSYAIFARNIQSEILLRTRQSKRLQGEING